MKTVQKLSLNAIPNGTGNPYHTNGTGIIKNPYHRYAKKCVFSTAYWYGMPIPYIHTTP